MYPTKVIIGTRGSRLALWQANYAQEQLRKLGVASELKVIKTRGDRIQDIGFSKMEGKGFFTKELETALLEKEVDLAVHSMKDLPTQGVEGLRIAAVSYRENPADWVVIRKESVDTTQPLHVKAGGILGTSSARRKAQTRYYQDNLELRDIRGNVPTRLQKLREGDFDAIMLAAAGVTRLQIDLSEFEVLKMSPKEFVPAPAQGVLAFQIREEDQAMRRLLRHIHQPEVVRRTNVERRLLRLFDGGCQLPLGVYCMQDNMDNYHVWAAQAETAESPVKRIQISSATHVNLAEQIFEKLQEMKLPTE